MIVARAHPQAPTDEGWRGRVRAVAERGARAVVSRSIAALSERDGIAGAEVLLLVPGGDEATAARAAEAVLREMEAGLAGLHVRARPQPHRRGPGRAAARRQRGAAGGQRRAGLADGAALAFEQTGAYRLLLSAMSENPRSCSASTPRRSSRWSPTTSSTRPIWCGTLETFLEADGNVAGTAQRLFTHRHTIYYRLERVRELSGLDVSSSDGREKLSLGLKAMRVLGIASAGGPASEAGAEGGRVPRRSRGRA